MNYNSMYNHTKFLVDYIEELKEEIIICGKNDNDNELQERYDKLSEKYNALVEKNKHLQKISDIHVESYDNLYIDFQSVTNKLSKENTILRKEREVLKNELLNNFFN